MQLPTYLILQIGTVYSRKEHYGRTAYYEFRNAQLLQDSSSNTVFERIALDLRGIRAEREL
jgi:hypothetical protein